MMKVGVEDMIIFSYMKIFKEQKLKASTMNTDIISDKLQSLVIRTWFSIFYILQSLVSWLEHGFSIFDRLQSLVSWLEHGFRA